MTSSRAPQAPRSPGLDPLSDEECWTLLASAQIGRVAMVHEDEPLILPVTYAVDGHDLVFRTTEQGLLGGAAAWGRRVVVEVDRIDEATHSGWSVLVRGELREVTGAEVDRLRALVTPWAQGDRPVLGRVVTSGVSGRRLPAA